MYKIKVVSVFLTCILISSCSTTFKLPDSTPPSVEVYLLKYSTWGHHSLAFYDDGELVEYTYGDWELFALNKRDSWTAWKNMTFATQGTLGRKAVNWSPGNPICENFNGCDAAVAFLAPKDKVTDLFSRLQKLYVKNSDNEIFNQEEGVYFVKYDRSYRGIL